MPMPPHPTPVLHGIPNCDTVRRARAWLAQQGVAAAFHDFKTQGVPAEALAAWAAALGWTALLNRQGTTWRKLSPQQQAAVTDAASAMALMRAQHSLIRRPVVRWPDGAVTVGFDAADWAGRLGTGSNAGADPAR
jgi:Spx/MgsR family transcriptional regulator